MSYLAEPPTHKFRTAEWEQKYGDCNCDDVSSEQGALDLLHLHGRIVKA